MAFLSDLWGKVKTTGGTVLTNVNGPSQSQSAQIPAASKDAKGEDGQPIPNLGVGDDGNFGQMATNMGAAFKQIDYLVDVPGVETPPLGNQFFVNTGGSCINTQGKLVSRYNYINNIPEDRWLFGQGLISGMITDMKGMVPSQLMKGMTAPATPACDLQDCPVTDVLNEPDGAAAFFSQGSRDSKYLSAGMTPDLKRSLGEAGCRKVELAPFAQAQTAQQATVNALQAEQTRLTEELSKNSNNKALKVALDDVTEKLGAAQADLSAMTQRAQPYSDTNKEGRQEAFSMMNSPATGGLLVAGILLTYLVFSKRR